MHQNLLPNNNDAQSTTKYGFLLRPDAQIVALRVHCTCTALKAQVMAAFSPLSFVEGVGHTAYGAALCNTRADPGVSPPLHKLPGDPAAPWTVPPERATPPPFSPQEERSPHDDPHPRGGYARGPKPPPSITTPSELEEYFLWCGGLGGR